MQIEIKRLLANNLYTEGWLFVNGKKYIPYTLEHTFTMLPIGTYHIGFHKMKDKGRVIGIFKKTNHSGRPIGHPVGTIETGNSYLSLSNGKNIIIGERIIPGAAKNGRTYYTRLFDRIENNLKTPAGVTLVISDKGCLETDPLDHWLLQK